MSFHGSDSALGSSNLYLDGIPFKLGEKFKRPPKVTMPESITQATVTAALTEEYSFSTEEAVLSWLADVQQADEIKKQQDLERKQTELKKPTSDSSADEDKTEVKEINDMKNWNYQAMSNKNSTWSNPVLANFSSDLLKPTPFMSNSSPLAQNTASSTQNNFDIRSFDKVDDPFDNLELQVIDDFEELQTILQGPQPTTQQNTTPKTFMDTDDTCNENNSQGPKISLRKNAVRLKREKVKSSSDIKLSGDTSNETPDYMNVKQFQVGLNQKQDESGNLPSIGNSHFNGQGQVVALPPLLRETKAISLQENTEITGGTVRPSSNPELLLLGNGLVSFKSTKEQYANVVVNTSQSNSDQENKGNIYSRHSISADYVNVDVFTKPVLGRSSDPADLSPINKTGLRGARSTPSLVHHEPQTPASTGALQSPPPRPSSGQSLLDGNDSENTVPKTNSLKSVTYENVQIEQSEKTSSKQYFCDVAPVPPIPKPRNIRVQPESLRPQPAKREFVCQEPAKRECGQQELVKLESECVKPEPIKIESVRSDYDKQQNVKQDNVQPDRVQQHPVCPVKPERSKPKSVQAEYVTPEPIRRRQRKGLENEGRVVGRSTFYENVEINNTLNEVAWNKHSPLPPPKTQTKQTVPALPPRSSKETQGARSSSLSSSSDVFNRAADSEDPYSSLSIEAQAFVSSLTGMGFPRARAARAVLKLGQDHKLVVEHLCLINSMVEKGYAAPLSEMALHLFTNDFHKAVKYLDLYLQFQELGFQNEKIREALVSNDVDRDKALDFLTA